jgi:hypothetical protein
MAGMATKRRWHWLRGGEAMMAVTCPLVYRDIKPGAGSCEGRM